MANFFSHDLVQVFLKDEIVSLDRKELKAHSKAEALPELATYWIGSKVILIELRYALYAGGSLNNGKIELNAIADFLKNHFV